MRADMGQQYHEVTRRQVDRVLMRERLKSIFKDDGGTDDDEFWLAAALDEIDTRDGAAELRRLFPRGLGSVAELDAYVRFIARRLRRRAETTSADDVERDPYQPWTANDADDAEQMNDDDAERVAATKSFPMRPRDEVLRRLMKSAGGVVPLCKQIIRDQETSISEFELTSLIVEQAKAEHPDLTDAAAFSKAFGAASPAGETLRRAVAVAKGASAPTPASDDHDRDRDIGGGADALAELERHAERLRAAQPALSFEQAFARVYSDPQHAHLVRRERRQNNPVLKLAR